MWNIAKCGYIIRSEQPCQPSVIRPRSRSSTQQLSSPDKTTPNDNYNNHNKYKSSKQTTHHSYIRSLLYRSSITATSYLISSKTNINTPFHNGNTNHTS